ncbi:hypothetical protein NFI96_006572, partial [Prochilodus magdalenae]
MRGSAAWRKCGLEVRGGAEEEPPTHKEIFRNKEYSERSYSANITKCKPKIASAREAEKMEMKMSFVGPVLGLVLLIAASSDAQSHGVGHPVQCCFTFSPVKIPARMIVKVEKTPSDCPLPGYVVTTQKNRFCKQEDIL